MKRSHARIYRFGAALTSTAWKAAQPPSGKATKSRHTGLPCFQIFLTWFACRAPSKAGGQSCRTVTCEPENRPLAVSGFVLRGAWTGVVWARSRPCFGVRVDGKWRWAEGGQGLRAVDPEPAGAHAVCLSSPRGLHQRVKSMPKACWDVGEASPPRVSLSDHS